MPGETLQPTATQLFESIASREALLRHGPGLVEFQLTYLHRDEATAGLSTRPDAPVTVDVAEKFKADFKAIVDTPGTKPSIKDATGMSWTEICNISMYLEQVTDDLPDSFVPFY